MGVSRRKGISVAEASHKEVKAACLYYRLVRLDLLDPILNVLFISYSGLLLFLDDLMTLWIS